MVGDIEVEWLTNAIAPRSIDSLQSEPAGPARMPLLGFSRSLPRRCEFPQRDSGCSVGGDTRSSEGRTGFQICGARYKMKARALVQKTEMGCEKVLK